MQPLAPTSGSITALGRNDQMKASGKRTVANNVQRGTFDPIKGTLVAQSQKSGFKLRDMTP